MRHKILVVVIAIAAVATACGGGGSSDTTASTSPPQATGDIAGGEVAYQQSCTACHGPDARGLEGLGKDLVGTDFINSNTDADLVAFLKVGRASSDPANTTGIDMPAKGGNPALTDTDLLNIVAYLRSLGN